MHFDAGVIGTSGESLWRRPAVTRYWNKVARPNHGRADEVNMEGEARVSQGNAGIPLGWDQKSRTSERRCDRDLFRP